MALLILHNKRVDDVQIDVWTQYLYGLVLKIKA